MEIMHARSEIKTMGIFPQLIGGQLDLAAALFQSNTASFRKHALAHILPSAGGIHYKFYDLGDPLAMVELFLEAQIQHGPHLAVRFFDKAIHILPLQLAGINFFKFAIGQYFLFHIADQVIHSPAVLFFAFPNHHSHLHSAPLYHILPSSVENLLFFS